MRWFRELFGAALLLCVIASSSWSKAGVTSDVNRVNRSIAVALPRALPQVIIGNPKGHDIVFEYYDYRCPFCRRMEPAMIEMGKEDPEMRLVLKPWPIFGPTSTYAARVAIAASWQNKLSAVHEALFAATGPLDRQRIRSIARSVGVDLKRLTNDLKDRRQELDLILASDAAEAGALRLKGTPGLVIKRQIVRGAVTLRDLQSLIRDEYPHAGSPQ